MKRNFLLSLSFFNESPSSFFSQSVFFSIFGNQQQKSQLRKIQLEFLRTFGTDGTQNWRFLLLEGAVRSEVKRDERFYERPTFQRICNAQGSRRLISNLISLVS